MPHGWISQRSQACSPPADALFTADTHSGFSCASPCSSDTYTPTRTPTTNQTALQQVPVENQITYTAMARDEASLLHCRGSRQLEVRDGTSSSQLSSPPFGVLPPTPVNNFSYDNTCWGLDTTSFIVTVYSL